MRAALALIALAGCASFEDPTIVLDLRVLGIETTPPEQILDVDPAKPPTLEQVLVQLQPIRIHALVAEPDRTGTLEWEARACILEERGSRCDPAFLSFEIARGVLADPETSDFGSPCDGEFTAPSGTVCADIVPDNVLVQMLLQALKDDVTGGLGGIDLGIELRVNGGHEVFAAKHVRFAPRIPKERKPNNNPRIESLLLGRGGFGAEVRSAHCQDNQADIIQTEQAVTFFPTAAAGDQEEYVLPTLDGHSETFKEYLSYQWIATAGSFVDDITGGPPDVFGNIKLDGTEWKAPKEPGLVTIWVIQRDSRYGVRWRQTCIKVEEP